MTVFTWDGEGADDNWTTPDNWNQDSSYPQTNEDSVIFNATSDDDCTVDTTVTIGILDIQDGYDGTITMANSLTIDDAGSYDGTLTITDPDAELDTGDEDLTVSGYTDIYGTLTPGASTCYFGYGNTASASWDLGVRGTGVLNAGTGDWYTGGFGAYSGADVTLTTGTMYISGTTFGHLWSPDQSVGSWDNNDGTVIIQKTGTIRTHTSDPLTAADNQICPFHTLIISGGADRTDAPVVTLKRGLKIDDELIIKNGVLQWDTYAGSSGDVWAVNGTELTGVASQSAAIVMDDMPARSAYYSAYTGSPTGDGFNTAGNAIISGATAKMHVGNWHMGTDSAGSASTANKAITGLNGTPYFTFPSGEACAVFWDESDRTNYIQMADDASLKPETAMTLCAWIKLDDTTQTQRVIHKYDANQGYLLSIDAGKIYWEIWIEEDGVPTRYESYSHGNIVADTWTHIGITYDSVTGYLREYQDGLVLDTTDLGTAGDSIATGSKVFRLGNSTNSLKGYMADARIYSEAKDGDDFAALAATNPATSVTATYPDTGSGLVGWWKLQPYQIVDGTGSGEMDFSDSSTNSNTGVNNGTVTGWGGLWLYNLGSSGYCAYTYQRKDMRTQNTVPLGVEGRGSTVYVQSQATDLSLVVNDGAAYNGLTYYEAGKALSFNNLNILPRVGGGVGTVQWGANSNYFSGFMDLSGDLFVASGSKLRAHIGNLDGLERVDFPTGYLYVSGNARLWGDLDVNPTSYITALADGEIPTMPQVYVEDSINIYGDAHYNATSYLTITRNNPGMARVDETATFTHNSGTYIYADKAEGGWGMSGRDWSGSNSFYNFIVSGTNLYRSNVILNVDNDMTLKNCTATDPNYRPYGAATYIGGDVNVESGCGFGNWYIGTTPGYNGATYISGNLNLNNGDLYITDQNNKDFWIYGSLFNRGGNIYHEDGS